MDKSVKYDRQLRLWAANGQEALEKSRICLINGTATGAETLKNLVLPGIGSFTIIDDKQVTEADTGTNFFLDVDSVGQNRAAKICEYLLELNTDVRGTYIEKDPTQLIDNSVNYFVDNFDVVVASDLLQAPLKRLASALWAGKIPLILVRSVGFVGYVRLAVPEHTIVESHPDSLTDLRLDCSWVDLLQLSSMDIDSMDENEHAHIPYVLLLLHYLNRWKDDHEGKTPSTFDEKVQFKLLIKSGMRSPDQENFDEAIANVWRACGKTSIPADVLNVFSDPLCRTLSSSSSNFWILARAVADFIASPQGNGMLPVSGILPDMKSDTTRYIALQNTYRRKAMVDIQCVKGHLARVLNSIGRPADSIPNAELATFCKHAGFIKVIRYRSLEEEFNNPNIDLFKSNLSDPEGLLPWYLAMRAASEFVDKYGHAPGSGLTESTDDDLQTLTEIAHHLGIVRATEGASIDLVFKACHEIVRYGGGELHNIASLMGGIIAQEIIKLVTKQYIPLNNTCIFNGITSTSQVYAL